MFSPAPPAKCLASPAFSSKSMVVVRHQGVVLHRLVGPQFDFSHRIRAAASASPVEIEDEAEMERMAQDLARRLSTLGTNFTDDEQEFMAEDAADDRSASSSSDASTPPASPAQARKATGPAIRPLGKRELDRRERVLNQRADAPRERDPSITPPHLLPKVAIVGRPNVGKSALFNRITGTQLAIVYDQPGITRDRLYHRANWNGREFLVVDTGGLTSDATQLPADIAAAFQAPDSVIRGKDSIPQAIERQAAVAVGEADVLVVVVDGQEGVTGADSEVIQWLRRHHSRKSIILAVNKCENAQKAELQASVFWELGIEPVPVSAISGTGTGDLMDKVAASLPADKSLEDGEEPGVEAPLRIAIVGRPNVGKSSLLNAIVGEERSIVSEMAGTTRDAVDTEFEGPDGRPYVLVDTAGIRRRAAVAQSPDGAEHMSVDRALRAVSRADVTVLVLDANEGVTVQDFRLAERIAEEGKACVVVANKWDVVVKDTNTMAEKEEDFRAQLRPIDWASIVFTSAKKGQRVQRVIEAARAAGEEHRRRVPTSTLNMVVSDATHWRSPPTGRSTGRKGRVYYATQAAVRPPTFVFFVNDPKLFTDDYRKFMERQMRENVGFSGTPVRVFWRGRGERNDRNGSRPPKNDRKVSVTTSDVPGGGTSARVFISLIGSDGSTKPVALPGIFDRSTRVVNVITDAPIGGIEKIEVGHDATGARRRWHLSYVEVAVQSGPQRGTSSVFYFNGWVEPRDEADKAAPTIIRIRALDAARRNVYKVVVRTGPGEATGAAPRVAVRFKGYDGAETEELLLSAEGRTCFQPGQTDVFFVDLGAQFSGKVQSIDVNYKEAEGRPIQPDRWFLESVTIVYLNTGDSTEFEYQSTIGHSETRLAKLTRFMSRRTLGLRSITSFRDGDSRLPTAVASTSKGSHRHCYKLTVYTSDIRNAGTDSRVFCTIYGSEGNTATTFLPGDFDRNTRIETLFTDVEVGRLETLRIGHDGSGLGAAWHLAYVVVEDLNASAMADPSAAAPARTSVFYFNDWIRRPRAGEAVEAAIPRLDSDNNVYKITVRTSDVVGAGTNKLITLALIGKQGTSSPEVDLLADRSMFDRGAVDVFFLGMGATKLGRLEGVDIGYRDRFCEDQAANWESSRVTDWHLHSVTVEHLNTGRRHDFIYCDWLANLQARASGKAPKLPNPINPSAAQGRLISRRSLGTVESLAAIPDAPDWSDLREGQEDLGSARPSAGPAVLGGRSLTPVRERGEAGDDHPSASPREDEEASPSSHPRVRFVEPAILRVSSGRPGESDLSPLVTPQGSGVWASDRAPLSTDLAAAAAAVAAGASGSAAVSRQNSRGPGADAGLASARGPTAIRAPDSLRSASTKSTLSRSSTEERMAGRTPLHPSLADYSSAKADREAHRPPLSARSGIAPAAASDPHAEARPLPQASASGRLLTIEPYSSATPSANPTPRDSLAAAAAAAAAAHLAHHPSPSATPPRTSAEFTPPVGFPPRQPAAPLTSASNGGAAHGTRADAPAPTSVSGAVADRSGPLIQASAIQWTGSQKDSAETSAALQASTASAGIASQLASSAGSAGHPSGLADLGARPAAVSAPASSTSVAALSSSSWVGGAAGPSSTASPGAGRATESASAGSLGQQAESGAAGVALTASAATSTERVSVPTASTQPAASASGASSAAGPKAAGLAAAIAAATTGPAASHLAPPTSATSGPAAAPGPGEVSLTSSAAAASAPDAMEGQQQPTSLGFPPLSGPRVQGSAPSSAHMPGTATVSFGGATAPAALSPGSSRQGPSARSDGSTAALAEAHVETSSRAESGPAGYAPSSSAAVPTASAGVAPQGPHASTAVSAGPQLSSSGARPDGIMPSEAASSGSGSTSTSSVAYQVPASARASTTASGVPGEQTPSAQPSAAAGPVPSEPLVQGAPSGARSVPEATTGAAGPPSLPSAATGAVTAASSVPASAATGAADLSPRRSAAVALGSQGAMALPRGRPQLASAGVLVGDPGLDFGPESSAAAPPSLGSWGSEPVLPSDGRPGFSQSAVGAAGPSQRAAGSATSPVMAPEPLAVPSVPASAVASGSSSSTGPSQFGAEAASLLRTEPQHPAPGQPTQLQQPLGRDEQLPVEGPPVGQLPAGQAQRSSSPLVQGPGSGTAALPAGASLHSEQVAATSYGSNPVAGGSAPGAAVDAFSASSGAASVGPRELQQGTGSVPGAGSQVSAGPALAGSSGLAVAAGARTVAGTSDTLASRPYADPAVLEAASRPEAGSVSSSLHAGGATPASLAGSSAGPGMTAMVQPGPGVFTPMVGSSGPLAVGRDLAASSAAAATADGSGPTVGVSHPQQVAGVPVSSSERAGGFSGPAAAFAEEVLSLAGASASGGLGAAPALGVAGEAAALSVPSGPSAVSGGLTVSSPAAAAAAGSATSPGAPGVAPTRDAAASASGSAAAESPAATTAATRAAASSSSTAGTTAWQSLELPEAITAALRSGSGVPGAGVGTPPSASPPGAATASTDATGSAAAGSRPSAASARMEQDPLAVSGRVDSTTSGSPHTPASTSGGFRSPTGGKRPFVPAGSSRSHHETGTTGAPTARSETTSATGSTPRTGTAQSPGGGHPGFSPNTAASTARRGNSSAKAQDSSQPETPLTPAVAAALRWQYPVRSSSILSSGRIAPATPGAAASGGASGSPAAPGSDPNSGRPAPRPRAPQPAGPTAGNRNAGQPPKAATSPNVVQGTLAAPHAASQKVLGSAAAAPVARTAVRKSASTRSGATSGRASFEQPPSGRPSLDQGRPNSGGHSDSAPRAHHSPTRSKDEALLGLFSDLGGTVDLKSINSLEAALQSSTDSLGSLFSPGALSSARAQASGDLASPQKLQPSMWPELDEAAPEVFGSPSVEPQGEPRGRGASATASPLASSALPLAGSASQSAPSAAAQHPGAPVPGGVPTLWPDLDAAAPEVFSSPSAEAAAAAAQRQASLATIAGSPGLCLVGSPTLPAGLALQLTSGLRDSPAETPTLRVSAGGTSLRADDGPSSWAPGAPTSGPTTAAQVQAQAAGGHGPGAPQLRSGSAAASTIVATPAHLGAAAGVGLGAGSAAASSFAGTDAAPPSDATQGAARSSLVASATGSAVKGNLGPAPASALLPSPLDKVPNDADLGLLGSVESPTLFDRPAGFSAPPHVRDGAVPVKAVATGPGVVGQIVGFAASSVEGGSKPAGPGGADASVNRPSGPLGRTFDPSGPVASSSQSPSGVAQASVPLDGAPGRTLAEGQGSPGIALGTGPARTTGLPADLAMPTAAALNASAEASASAVSAGSVLPAEAARGPSSSGPGAGGARLPLPTAEAFSPSSGAPRTSSFSVGLAPSAPTVPALSSTELGGNGVAPQAQPISSTAHGRQGTPQGASAPVLGSNSSQDAAPFSGFAAFTPSAATRLHPSHGRPAAFMDQGYDDVVADVVAGGSGNAASEARGAAPAPYGAPSGPGPGSPVVTAVTAAGTSPAQTSGVSRFQAGRAPPVSVPGSGGRDPSGAAAEVSTPPATTALLSAEASPQRPPSRPATSTFAPPSPPYDTPLLGRGLSPLSSRDGLSDRSNGEASGAALNYDSSVAGGVSAQGLPAPQLAGSVDERGPLFTLPPGTTVDASGRPDLGASAAQHKSGGGAVAFNPAAPESSPPSFSVDLQPHLQSSAGHVEGSSVARPVLPYRFSLINGGASGGSGHASSAEAQGGALESALPAGSGPAPALSSGAAAAGDAGAASSFGSHLDAPTGAYGGTAAAGAANGGRPIFDPRLQSFPDGGDKETVVGAARGPPGHTQPATPALAGTAAGSLDQALGTAQSSVAANDSSAPLRATAAAAGDQAAASASSPKTPTAQTSSPPVLTPSSSLSKKPPSAPRLPRSSTGSAKTTPSASRGPSPGPPGRPASLPRRVRINSGSLSRASSAGRGGYASGYASGGSGPDRQDRTDRALDRTVTVPTEVVSLASSARVSSRNSSGRRSSSRTDGPIGSPSGRVAGVAAGAAAPTGPEEMDGLAKRAKAAPAVSRISIPRQDSKGRISPSEPSPLGGMPGLSAGTSARPSQGYGAPLANGDAGAPQPVGRAGVPRLKSIPSGMSAAFGPDEPGGGHASASMGSRGPEDVGLPMYRSPSDSGSSGDEWMMARSALAISKEEQAEMAQMLEEEFRRHNSGYVQPHNPRDSEPASRVPGAGQGVGRVPALALNNWHSAGSHGRPELDEPVSGRYVLETSRINALLQSEAATEGTMAAAPAMELGSPPQSGGATDREGRKWVGLLATSRTPARLPTLKRRGTIRTSDGQGNETLELNPWGPDEHPGDGERTEDPAAAAALALAHVAAALQAEAEALAAEAELEGAGEDEDGGSENSDDSDLFGHTIPRPVFAFDYAERLAMCAVRLDAMVGPEGATFSPALYRPRVVMRINSLTREEGLARKIAEVIAEGLQSGLPPLTRDIATNTWEHSLGLGQHAHPYPYTAGAAAAQGHAAHGGPHGPALEYPHVTYPSPGGPQGQFRSPSHAKPSPSPQPSGLQQSASPQPGPGPQHQHAYEYPQVTYATRSQSRSPHPQQAELTPSPHSSHLHAQSQQHLGYVHQQSQPRGSDGGGKRTKGGPPNQEGSVGRRPYPWPSASGSGGKSRAGAHAPSASMASVNYEPGYAAANALRTTSGGVEAAAAMLAARAEGGHGPGPKQLDRADTESPLPSTGDKGGAHRRVLSTADAWGTKSAVQTGKRSYFSIATASKAWTPPPAGAGAGKSMMSPLGTRGRTSSVGSGVLQIDEPPQQATKAQTPTLEP